MKRCLLTVQPGGIVIPVPFGTLLSDALLEAGWALPLPCGGQGVCGKCGVSVQKNPEEAPVTLLACRTPVVGDWNVSLSGLQGPSCSIRVGEFSDTPQAVYGCAVDLGSTTVVLSLWRLDTNQRCGSLTFTNPQRCAGDDILSRIHAVQADPEMLPFLTRLIRSAIAGGAESLLSDCGIDSPKLIRYVVVGNTVMQQLFLDLSPVALGHAPFTPAFTALQSRAIGALALPGKPGGELFVFPQIGGFVGGDTVAGLLSLRKRGMLDGVLMMDLGTNAEIAWMDQGKVSVTSAAAGPALEGAALESGCSAVPGAICSVDGTSPGKWKVNTIRDQPANGICGSGYVQLVDTLLQRGTLAADGSWRYQAGNRLQPFGEEGLAFLVAGTAEGAARPCLLTQGDIRKIQLAKGAIATGIELLLKSAGKTFSDVRTWVVAGALGSAISRSSLERLGILPPHAGGEFHVIGNAALAGAELFLRIPSLKEQMENIQKSSALLELANHPQFQEAFISHLNFPAS